MRSVWEHSEEEEQKFYRYKAELSMLQLWGPQARGGVYAGLCFERIVHQSIIQMKTKSHQVSAHHQLPKGWNHSIKCHQKQIESWWSTK